MGGPPPRPVYPNAGDPVASGIAVAGGVVFFTTVASGKLVALDADTGAVLKEFDLGMVWAGPAVSRGRVYVGSGNALFTRGEYESFYRKQDFGVLYSFGLPEEDEVDRLGGGEHADGRKHGILNPKFRNKFKIRTVRLTSMVSLDLIVISEVRRDISCLRSERQSSLEPFPTRRNASGIGSCSTIATSSPN